MNTKSKSDGRRLDEADAKPYYRAKQAEDIEASIDRIVAMLHNAPRFKRKAALFDQLMMTNRNVRVLAADLHLDHLDLQHVPK